MIAKWFMVGWLALGALLSVAFIGKPRWPTTPGQAAFYVALTAVEIVLIIVFWETS